MAIKFLNSVAVNTDVLFVDTANERVGIGTASPSYKLDVSGTGRFEDTLSVNGKTVILNNGTLTWGASSDYGQLSWDTGYALYRGQSGKGIKLQVNSSSTAMTLTTGGNVGIGTTTPGAKLDVNGDVFINSNYTGSNAAANDLTIGKTTTGNHGITIATGPTYTGSIYFGDSGNNDAGIIGYQHSSNSMKFTTNRSEKMRITSGGNVGIGTTSPSMKLEVSTDAWDVAKFTGNTDDGSGYVGAIVEIESNNDARGRGVYLTHRLATDTSDSEWYAGVPYTGGGYSIGNAAYGTSVNSNTGPAHKDQSKLFITEPGNVGIGTTSPSTKLHVAGIAQVTESGNSAFYGGNYLRVFNDQVYTMRNSGGNQRFAFDNTSGSLSTYNSSNVRTTYFNNSGSSYINGGNVGIGTTSPSAALEVVGGIKLSDNSPLTWATSSTRIFGQSGYMQLQVASADVMRLTSSGNVGIGTISPSEKLHVDGNARITGAYYDSGNTPGTANQLLASTATGTAWIDPSTIVAEAATLVVVACKNTSGATIPKGTPVYQTGNVGATATIEIAPADALISANKLPAIGLLQTDLNNNGFGNVVITGELTNFTTSPIDGVVPTTGDKVFVKSGGGLTLTKPTGEGNGIQNMGLVGKVSGGNSGSITVSSIMRTNDVPNLPEGRIWVGDGNTIVSDTVYIDEPNGRMGIGTTAPSEKLHVEGDIRLLDELIFGEYSTTTDRLTNQSYALTMAHSTALNFKVGTASVFNVYGTQIRPQVNNTVDLGHGGFRWKTGYFAGNLIANSIGIGTDFPSDELTIEAETPTIRLKDISSSNYAEFYVNNFDTYLDSAGRTFIQSGGSTNVTVTSAGNVGIGTTSPSQKLEVNGNAIVSGIGVGTTTIYSNSINLNNSGTLRIGNAEFLAKASNDLSIYQGKILVQQGGNVGIGTTSPNYNLQVAGGINAGGKVTYSKAAGSLDTTGYAVAGLTTGTNGKAAGFIFTCFGGGGYQRIVYSCKNVSGTWQTSKDIDEGVNALDVVASTNATTITFTFKARTTFQNYTPSVTVEATGTSINNTYA